MAYNNSTVEPKRSHQWFMDGIEPELLPNKKQAFDVTNNHSFTALLNSNISPWMNASSFHSLPGQYSERLLDGDIGRPVNYDDRNVMSIGFGGRSMARKSVEDSFGTDSSFGLSIAEGLEDPRLSLNYGGIRKVKVSQVKDTDKFMPVTMVDNYTMGVNSTVPTDHGFCKVDGTTVSMGLSFNRVDDNVMPLGDTFNREDSSFISMSQPLNKMNANELTGSHSFKERDCYLSVNHSFDKDDTSIATHGQTFSRDDSNSISVGNSIKDNSPAFMGQSFRNDDSSNTPLGQNFNKTTDSTALMANCYGRVNESAISLMQTYNEVDSNNVSMGHSFGREGNIISFGGFDNDDDVNASGRLLSSYDLLMAQSSGKRSENPCEKGLVESNADKLTNASLISASGGAVTKKDEQKANKKPAPNSFPSNVRSLLSTGIFDGVPVKYIAWSREKELRGIIKGTGYLCGCQSCIFSKTINAYEFERHAGCKTKHPNNHIYFENGKTIYGIVQELRNTRQDLLFEVIQTISGSPINQKSFRIWKESFLAATRELQRIYAKDEGKLLS
ncbi:uncharacterized protein LOC116006551 isoform X1 [Ipomoea triloba]|uniref:uncharacterized protein LOC116006551 isoform X1 n=1 Tax=Ipomoea triloba TaxID=35885 RepID=UPI00125DE0CB|nr:uncharacterized protein LOC116006551 isoform X1 [Ipomoea triloba]XP_031102835.1 uncharacterized protein LOC116006551 isoform X1 [Ipomoea triloba]